MRLSNTRLIAALCLSLLSISTSQAAPVGLSSSTNVIIDGVTGIGDCAVSQGNAQCADTIVSMLSGAASANHNAWDFDLATGDLVTIEVIVTSLLPGSLSSAFPGLYLFDANGIILAQDTGVDGVQIISDFQIGSTGIFYAGVSGIGNNPTHVTDVNSPINGWDEDSSPAASAQAFNYDFYVTIQSSTPIPVPAAAYLLASGLIGLIGIGRKTRLQASNT